MPMVSASNDRRIMDHRNDVQRINTDYIEQILQSSSIETCRDKLSSYFDEIGFCGLESLMLRLYIAMDIYLLTRSFCKSIGIPDEKFVRTFGSIDDIESLSSADATVEFFTEMIVQCLKWRIELAHENSGDAIKRAKEYIDKKYTAEDISLKSVATAMNFSPAYFSSLFKKEMGMNFINYLTQVRIHKAKALLCCTSKMVYEVAEEVGFRDYRYFSQIFKKYTGQTPHEFQSSSNKSVSAIAESKA